MLGKRLIASSALALVVVGCGLQGADDHVQVRPADRSIELAFSRGDRNGGAYYTVNGLVRNPGPDALEAVDVYCTLEDKHGSVVGFGQHLIDVYRLEPGGESAFHVNVQYEGPVATYTLNFQTVAGQRLRLSSGSAP